jgi:FtsP/CotA-like multicopper oxidase with cupredoxin domain
VIDVKLNARSHLATVAGSPVYARTYNGEFVGPTIHVRPGDAINVTFNNDLGKNDDGPVPTNIHYHGLHVSPLGESDNIFRTFDAGKTYRSTVKLERNQPVGTYWYHAHFHHISDGQVMGGMSGLIMIDGLKSLLPKDFRDVTERQVTLRDVQLAPRKTKEAAYDVIADNVDIQPSPDTTYRMVNGLYKPKFTMQSDKYELWHLANIGSDVFYKVTLARQKDPNDKSALDQQSFFVLAEDGLPVWKVSSEKELLIPPGKRFDVLVLGREKGTYELLSVPYAQRANKKLVPKEIPCEGSTPCTPVPQTLATVTTEGPSRAVPTVPDRVVKKNDPDDPTTTDLSEIDVEDLPKHEFTFSYNDDDPNPPEKFEARINGEIFDINQDPIVAPVLRSAEEWTLVNNTRDDHPFHIHVNGFQVIKVSDEKGVLQDYEAHGHQDVVNIPRARNADTDNDPETPPVKVDGKVVIRHKFLDFDGWFVFHCHILNHEDTGMMRTIQVLKDKDDTPRPPPEASQPHAMGHQ